VGELGIGYFNHFKENWWVEVYAGYRYGHAAAYGNDYFLLSGDEYSFSGVYQKAYIQPSMGLREEIF